MIYDRYLLGVFDYEGFGSKGPLREPYQNLLTEVKKLKPSVLISIDIPTGWVVDDKNTSDDPNKIRPDMIISLTLPVSICLVTCRKYALAHSKGNIF